MSNNRVFKLKSVGAVDPCTFAEMGEKLAKKTHKGLISRKRRITTKQDLRKQFRDESI